MFFLNEKQTKSYQNILISIVDAGSDLETKILLLRLFYKRIDDKSARKQYETYISSNFTQIGVDAIYDFAFNKWLKPSKNQIDDMINSTLHFYRSNITGVKYYPDPVKSNLDCAFGDLFLTSSLFTIHYLFFRQSEIHDKLRFEQSYFIM